MSHPSPRSLRNYAELHPMLKKLCDEAWKVFDFELLDGTRTQAEQEAAFKAGTSKVHYPKSAHNYIPAVAMDIVPNPIDWDNLKPFIHLQFEVIKPIAKGFGIPIRQGLDWNMNGSITDKEWRDYPHVELHPWKQWAAEGRPIT